MKRNENYKLGQKSLILSIKHGRIFYIGVQDLCIIMTPDLHASYVHPQLKAQGKSKILKYSLKSLNLAFFFGGT